MKRFDNGTLPRGREHRTRNGGVDNRTQWIRDNNTASNKGSRTWVCNEEEMEWVVEDGQG